MECKTEWAKALSGCALDNRDAEQAKYNVLLELIRNACNGAFDIAAQPNCRHSKQGWAILQVKELPWEYVFDCMKVSGKDFRIIPPEKVNIRFGKYLHKKEASVYGWYEAESDAIHIFSYTGRYKEEEDTSPGYDGYGKYDTYYEIVEAWMSRDGVWVKPPKTRYISLYTM